MRRLLVLTLIISSLIVGGANAVVTWTTITGPVADSATWVNHIGTDGTSLYAVFQDQTFFRYSFNPADPTYGSWVQLATPPRAVTGGVSYSDLAYQSGYLYTCAASNAGGSGRTILRYRISTNTWEIWQNAGVDIVTNNLTNSIFMNPTLTGVGYAVWASGNAWVKFDWNAKTSNNGWMSTGGLGVTDSSWVSRNDDVALSGAGTYYATKNDWTVGLSGGDVVYKWTSLTSPAPTVVKQKPWQCGIGQSLEFVPAATSPSGHTELWMIRGSDGSGSPQEGYGNPTDDWARLDLTNLAAGWQTGKLPGAVGYTGELVYIQGSIFARGVDDAWYVSVLAANQTVPSITVTAAKAAADGSSVSVQGVATAVYPGVTQFYIEDPLRSSGIQVRSLAGTPLASMIGQPVQVSGTIRTDPNNHERCVETVLWWQTGPSQAVTPLALNTRALGGRALGLQEGVYGGTGLGNVGLLVKLCGKVTSKAEDGSYVYVSDGSGVKEDQTDGVRVDLSVFDPVFRPNPTIGHHVMVTGSSSICRADDGNLRPVIRVRDLGDFLDLADTDNWPKTKKVLVINLDPIIESQGNRRLHTVCGWSSPKALAQGYVADLAECSGGWANYEIADWIDADHWPTMNDGFSYDDTSYFTALNSGVWHPGGVNYYTLLSDFNVVPRIASGEIDELFVFGAPGFGFYESCMAGPAPYFVNGGTFYVPAATRNFVIMGFNYERGNGEMMEDYGHRTESIMRHVYGTWSASNPTNNWEFFTLVDKNVTGRFTSGCGNVHFSPNSLSDYDWGNTNYVYSTCDDWLYNWPNLQGDSTKRLVNCTEWGNGDMRLHHKWWFKHLPHKPGINPDGKQNNWWKYTADFNNYPESSH